MTAPPSASGLPAYADYVSSVERAPARAGTRWPFLVLIVLGALLVVTPIVTAMFPRAVRGEAMIDAFRPYVTQPSVDGYRADLRVLADARTNVLALQARDQVPGHYERIDTFVREYPAIDSDMSAMIDTIDANRANYEKLSATAPFGSLPWLLALPGLVIAGAGILGLRRAGAGRRTTVWRAVAVFGALILIAVPFAGRLFPAAPAAQPLIDGFRSILTQSEVRKVQGYFVTLVAADGELNSRFTAAVRTAHPDAELAGITALESDWQPMTSRFAALIGAMNDNVDNFDAIVALNDSTKSLGFKAFRGIGWFYLIPGALVLVLATAGIRPRRIVRGGESQ
ncbi:MULTISPECIES: hypothetical protein [unclassified Nocardia]|uniref:hypothetical protein n=1 Tax=unclassified Nocardia TaxID=2637762 RepID=UPI001CE3D78E|nr:MULTISPECIES: hypothetical protein [unclassified Nocardia]